MLSNNRSTSRILSTLNEQTPLFEWLGDGFGLHLQIGSRKHFVTFRIKNGFDNINWAGTALLSFLAFNEVQSVDAMRYYGMQPSKWIKLFFRSGNNRYQYEGPYVGVYREIVDKLETGLCGADIDMPGYSSFSVYSPMEEGDSIAAENTFGAAVISRRLHAQANAEFENCLIENLNLNNSQEDIFIRHDSFLDFLFANTLQIFMLLATAIVAYYLYASLTSTNHPTNRRFFTLKKTDPSLQINVTPINGASFEKMLSDVDEEELSKVPKEFCCPVSLCLMNQPVVLNDGQTYDYATILRWLEEKGKNANCPLNPKIPITSITDNIKVRQQIEAYVNRRQIDAPQEKFTSEQPDVKSVNMSWHP